MPTNLYPCGENRWSSKPDAAGLPVVYGFDNTAGGGDWHQGYGMAEDGNVLAGHISSSYGWSRRDVGTPSDPGDTGGWQVEGIGEGKHEKYAAHYPGGYIFEWVPREALTTNAGLAAAFAKNAALPPDATEEPAKVSER